MGGGYITFQLIVIEYREESEFSQQPSETLMSFGRRTLVVESTRSDAQSFEVVNRSSISQREAHQNTIVP